MLPGWLGRGVAGAVIVAGTAAIFVGSTAILHTLTKAGGAGMWEVLVSRICSGGAMDIPLAMSFHSALIMLIEY